jgi:hypothetical protein
VRILHGKRALLVASLLGAGGGLSYGLVAGMEQGGLAGLYAGLSAGLHDALSYGLLSLAISALSAVLRRGVHLAERLEWTWESVQRSLATPRRLRSTLTLVSLLFVLFGSGQGLGAGLHQGLNQALSQGLSWGPGCWLLLVLFQAVSYRRVDNRDRHAFNRGIRASFSHSLVMGIIGALLVGCMSVLALELSYGLHDVLVPWLGDPAGSGPELNHIWLFIMSGGLLAGLLSGGLAVLRHSILRLLLWRAGLFPWKVYPFLQGAVARMLLLPLGAGYIFAHRQLLEYLASTPADEQTSDHSSTKLPSDLTSAQQRHREESLCDREKGNR